jgi:hypothetical protein
MSATWAIVPFVDLWDMTLDCANDLLAQTSPTRLLLMNNGGSDETRKSAEKFATANHPRVLLWSHDPQLPSLGASWNRALDFVWQTGGESALVPNNDVRLNPRTLELLLQGMAESQGLFVSAVNTGSLPEPYEFSLTERGGPDFSCFLISKECHQKYRFDDNLTYCNDLDMHRRMMLGGDGKRIFSLLVPYQHLEGGSATIKKSNPERSRIYQHTAQLHREYYARKWGGGVNEERYLRPFSSMIEFPVKPDGTLDEDAFCITTPKLQSHGCNGTHFAPGVLTPEEAEQIGEPDAKEAP